MIALSYPEPSFRYRKQNGQKQIFDMFRKKWLPLTEEEWVRQNFLRYLTDQLHYPPALIAVEKMIMLNGLKKRFDILVYDAAHQPWMLIECKAVSVNLDQSVIDQVLRYQMSVPAKYLVITNGNTTYAWQTGPEGVKELDAFPGLNAGY